MFLTAREMYALEEKVFSSGVSAESLMNEAGRKVALEILHRFQHQPPGRAIGIIGTGNNGADAMVALRHLKEAGWKVAIRCAHSPDSFGGLAAVKFQELGQVEVLDSLPDRALPGSMVLIDGLLGIGTTGDLREPLAGLARKVNELSCLGRAFVVSVDVPSGLNCDSGHCGKDTIRAHLTCTLGSPKLGLIADSAINHVGSLALLKIQGLSDWDLTQDHVVVPSTLPVDQLHRPHDFHKGQAGRVGLIAGSRGLAGAAALASLGALHGGGGLITLFVKEDDYPLILPLIPVEVMVRPVTSYRDVLDWNLDALAIGPGLGHPGPELLSVITGFKNSIVVDADALNLIARRSSISSLSPRHLVTPHPGEMARLLEPRDISLSRVEIAREFKRRSKATLLFKGARSLITAEDQPIAYNTTGTPGMATEGQGDVLSGLLASLLARGISPFEAAKLGAWIAGRASEIALHGESMESLSATSTAKSIGSAFTQLRQSVP